MKRLFTFIIAALTVLFVQAPFTGTAEAARVAVVPIQVNEEQVERAADFSSYYWDIIIEKYQYPEYELIDDEKVAAVIPEDGLKTFDEATLKDICEKSDAEIAVAMRLDEVKERPLFFRREPYLETFMKGEFASYNRLTGKYYHNKIYEKGEIEEVLTLRTDWQYEVFSSELKRHIYRSMGNQGKVKNKKVKNKK